MATALRLPAAEDTLHEAFAKMIERLNRAGGGAYELAVANSLWGRTARRSTGTPIWETQL